MDKQKWLLVVIMISVIFSGRSYGGEYMERSRIHPEVWYQEKWCQEHGGETEVSLNDGTRADCVTPSHIIEFDFGDKWYESVAQSLHYSLNHTEKRKPGIVLIIEDEAGDEKYWERLNNTADSFHLPVDTWTYGEGITERFKERTEMIMGDTNGDNRIGLVEAVNALQIISGIK